MPWIRIEGVKGLLYKPRADPSVKRKHPCPDCAVCGMCGDARCAACGKRRAGLCGRKRT